MNLTSSDISFTNFKVIVRIAFKKPKLLLKLVRGYLRALLNLPSPRTLGIALSYSCNFKCNHCSATTLVKPESERLTKLELKQIAKDANEMGILFFHFTGGEPLMDKTFLFETIKTFNPNENLISIQTNGWFIDEQFLDEYKKIKGDFICISVDSADPTFHDEFRGHHGSWDKALKAIKLARTKNIKTLISYTLTHEKLINKDFDKMILLSKQLGVLLFVVFAMPTGKWDGNSKDLLNQEDKNEFLLLLKKHQHIRTDRDSNWKKKGCPALKEAMYLTPYGDILPCPFIQVSFGNIRKHPLQNIFIKALKSPCLIKQNAHCVAAETNGAINYFSP